MAAQDARGLLLDPAKLEARANAVAAVANAHETATADAARDRGDGSDGDAYTVVAVPETDEERRPPERAAALADPTVGDAAAVDAGTLDDPARYAGYASAAAGESPPVFARGDPLYVTELYVRPEYRGDGLATDLLDAVEAWGRDRGCERAELHMNVS